MKELTAKTSILLDEITKWKATEIKLLFKMTTIMLKRVKLMIQYIYCTVPSQLVVKILQMIDDNVMMVMEMVN